MKKGTMISVLFAAAALLFSACEKSGNDNITGNNPEVEYAYVPEYTKLGGGEWVSFQDIQFAGDYLFYDQVFFDVVNQKNVPVLKQYSLTENKVLREMDMLCNLEDGRRRQIGKYYVQEDGKLYTTESIYSLSSRQVFLCAYDAEWNLSWEQDITDILDKVKKNSQAAYIAVDIKGRICLAVNGTLCLFDAKGMHQADVTLGDAYIAGLSVDRDGGVYVCYNKQKIGADYCLAQVDFKKGAQGVIYQNFPDAVAGRTFSAGLESDFLIIGTGYMYGYEIATQRAKELLSWTECGMEGSGVMAVGVGRDGQILAFWQDSGTGESFLVTMEKVEAASLPEKTQVVIGCLGDDYHLQQEAAAFNRQSTNCYVTVKNYAVAEDGREIDYQDCVTAFGMALATGIDCPDILVLSHMESCQMDIEAMAGNGTFVDLEPLLKGSSLLKTEDYLENALDCYRYQGVLVGIPSNITLKTVAGRTSDVGEESGWTLQEMMAYAAAHPEKEFWAGATRESILNDCLAFGLDAFVDRESGQCRFASEDFKEFLAFAGSFPEKYDHPADGRCSQRRVRDGDVLLYPVMINDFYGIQEYQEMFQMPVTYIGYPAVEGSGCIAECEGALALSAQSANKEAAWEFIEYHLARQSDSKTLYGFSTRKSILDRQMDEAVTVSYYLDDEGNPLLDADGNPVSKDLGGVRWGFDEDEITFRTATEEEARCVRELIESACKVPATDSKIMEIIREETQPFFQGQKSVEEAAGIIQSRVQLYMDERQ